MQINGDEHGALAVLILAGGESRRFDGCKLLAPLKGRALLWHTLQKARHLAPGHCYLLTGAWHEKLVSSSALDLHDISVLHHPRWARGMGSSIARGIAALEGKYDQVLIMLADQPLIRVEDYRALLSAPTSDHWDISCALYAGRRGVPAVFRSSCFQALMALDAEQGAKALLESSRFKVIQTALARAERDIDNVAQLCEIRSCQTALHSVSC
ncbi:MAG: nucleotidyltransferase family protein [Pseudomonadales bacterium]